LRKRVKGETEREREKRRVRKFEFVEEILKRFAFIFFMYRFLR
jgi:hypothetical protein